MRAGRLKTKRYKVRRRGGRGVVVLLLAALLLAGAAYMVKEKQIPVFAAPSPTLTPAESRQETRTITLPAATWYALQLGVFEQESAAKSLAESYQGRGAAGYIDDGEHYRVLAAAYETRADAQAVQQQLHDVHGVDAYIGEISRPAVTIRLTGQAAQLTALRDAYDLMDQAAAQLSALSRGLDGQEKRREDILPQLSSLLETVRTLTERLERLFGEAPHRAVAEMQSMLRALSDALSDALNAKSDVRLGAKIKYCQLLCASRMASYALGLSS